MPEDDHQGQQMSAVEPLNKRTATWRVGHSQNALTKSSMLHCFFF